MEKKYAMTAGEGFAPKIESLVVFLQATKQRIIDIAEPLSRTDLDFQLDKATPTIGTLLKHMICTEEWFRVLTFEFRDFSGHERKFWEGCFGGPGELLDGKINGNNLDYYTGLWQTVRKKTIKNFQSVEDDWLWKPHGAYTNYFTWFHLIEDHFCHLGQIKSIKKRFPNEKP